MALGCPAAAKCAVWLTEILAQCTTSLEITQCDTKQWFAMVKKTQLWTELKLAPVKMSTPAVDGHIILCYIMKARKDKKRKFQVFITTLWDIASTNKFNFIPTLLIKRANHTTFIYTTQCPSPQGFKGKYHLHSFTSPSCFPGNFFSAATPVRKATQFLCHITFFQQIVTVVMSDND